MGLLQAIFGRRARLPRDQVARVPRRVRKAAAAHIKGMQGAVDAISALPGLADVGRTKRVPRGFYEAVDELLGHYDAYLTIAREKLGLQDAPVAGVGDGVTACYEVPTGVLGIEGLNIYRHVRTWRDFPQVAQSMGQAAEQLFADIQSGHKGKDPEKIRMTGKAVVDGRLRFTRREVACPFLDARAGRCRIWDARPIVCRMHHLSTDPAWSHPGHPQFGKVKARNVRLPIRQQVELGRIDKRMALQPSPFLYASVLQLLQLADGELIQEAGEAPRRMQQDGRVANRANRQVKHARKFKKKKR